jgi:DNA-binding transcriptional regulator YhcF (GntR family)
MSNALSGVRLDHYSPVPLYHQAARALEEAIEDGRLPRGSKLESELDLVEQLGISRPTVRAAIKQLVDKGLLMRRRGIGTMVALTSLYDDLKAAGREPKTRVMSMEEVPSLPEIAEHLSLESGDPVLSFERLRVAGSDPIALMTNYVPTDLIDIERGPRTDRAVRGAPRGWDLAARRDPEDRGAKGRRGGGRAARDRARRPGPDHGTRSVRHRRAAHRVRLALLPDEVLLVRVGADRVVT